MSLGLLTRAWSGRRRGSGIADHGVQSGRRRVFGIADQGLVAVLVRVAAGVLAPRLYRIVRVRAVADPNGSFFKGRACTESSFLAFGAGPGSGGSKRFIFERPGLYRIVIFGFWLGSGIWRTKTAHF